MFGLSVDTLRNIREVFARFPSIEKILLYGSRAKGNYKTGSDIDITLIGKNLNLNSTSSLLRDALDQLYLPYTFDISIFNQLDEPAFIDHILRVGKTFYKREIPGLPKGWEMKVLGEICDIYQPKTISKKEMLSEGEYPVFGANGIIGRYYKYNHEDPQLLITCRGATCGSVNVSQSKSWITGNAMVIRPTTNDLSLRFLEYIFRGNFDVSSVITGAAQPQITRKSLAPVAITFPQLAEQKRIVAILDKAFAAIDTATANTQKNLANARELFESQLEHEFTDDTVNEGWMSTTLGNVCSFENGDRGKNYPSRSAYVPEGMPFVNAGHLGEGWVMSEGLNYISKEKYELLGSGKFNTGDILFCLRGSLGKFGVVGPDVGEGAIASSLVIVRPKLTQEVMHTLSPEFLSLYFRSTVCTRMIDNFSGGAAQPNLAARDLANFKIAFPPLPEQKRIVAILDKLSAETRSLSDTYNTKLNALAELKQSLLHKAFCGEV